MAFRKNKKRIDPRYFLNETKYRDLDPNVLDVMDSIQYDVEDLAEAGMDKEQIFNNLMSRREDLQGKDEEVKLVIAELIKTGPQEPEDVHPMAYL